MSGSEGETELGHRGTVMVDNTVRIYRSFSDLPPAYNTLFAAAAQKSFYLSREWFDLIFRACGAGNDAARIYAVESEPDIPAAALVMSESAAHDRFPQGRTLRSMSNWYSGIFSPVVTAQSDNTQVLNALYGAVARDVPRWDTIDISPFDVDDPAYSASIEAFRANGLIPQTYHHSSNWYGRFDGTRFDDYWNTLTSKKRNTLRRRQKAAQASGTIEFRMYTDETDLDRALRDYGVIYAESWKEAETFTNFVPELIRLTAANKTLRLGILHVDGQPAAFELCIVVAGVALMVKTAYIPKFANLSVGTLAIWWVLQHVLDSDRIHEIDFGNGDDTYKREWVQSRRERWGLIGFNARTLRGIIGAGWNIGGRMAKAKLRAVTRRRHEDNALAPTQQPL